MSKPLVLIVDDELGLLKLFAGLLGRLDCDVLQADGGDTALEILGQQTPDLLVLDLAMPEISGQDVLDYVIRQARLDGMRVIILTAHGATHFPEVFGSRISLWISKPVMPADFLNSVEDVLNS